MTLDLGIVASVRVGDRVWYDNDGDGMQDDPADEPGVADVTVVLLNADGTLVTDMSGDPVEPQSTDEDGNYLFDELPPGDYHVLFDLDTLPVNHVVTDPNTTNDQSPETSDQTDSDADPVTGLTGDTGPLMAGDEDTSLDMGILPSGTVAVGDRVWVDNDKDGIQGDPADEPGVEGVTAMVFNADGSPAVDEAGNPVPPQQTDASGNYLFDNLPEGNYYVEFMLDTLPDGYQVTEQNATSDQSPATSHQSDSDADPNTGRTDETGFLPAGSADLTLDLGIVQTEPVRVGDRVWYDNNGDGIQDDPADEPGVSDVEVTLFDGDGNPVGTTVTDENGEYIFENLPEGDYYVQFNLDTLPENYIVTTPNATSDQRDSDASPSTGETERTGFLPGGSEDLTLDMGIVQPVSDVRVGDRVWLDEDRDGIQEAGEPGVEDVTMTLYETLSNEPVATTVTDVDGNYLFDELFPGNYYVVFDLATLPTNHIVTEQDATNDQSPDTSDQSDSDASPEDGRTSPTGILFAGEENLSLDMGIYPVDKVRVGDLVWYDLDRDGLQDPDEPGVSDVTATLYDESTGQPVPGVPSEQTDSAGNYLFDNLPAGDYYVVFDLETLPVGYSITEPNQPATSDQPPNTSDQLDSDVDSATGETAPTGFLSDNQEDLTLDMGIVELPGVTVGDLVWFDDNGDGVQDPSEEGVPGITAHLYDESTGELVTDEAGDPLVQVTDGEGEYLFTELPPGQYRVQFVLDTLPDDHIISPVDQETSDTADSDTAPDTGTTSPTDVLAHSDEDRTLDMGIYKPVEIGDVVWFDNGNGQQDEDEAGVPDVNVTLYDAETGDIVGTTTTDENGNYLFDMLPPGDYKVQFDLASLPEGYLVIHPNMGDDDSADSDVNPETGETPATGFLSSGTQDLTLDMGIVQPVEVGDYVWYDEDMDGFQGEGELGVENVTVQLYDGTGQPVSTTTTDSTGAYLFDNLPPSDYVVVFDLTTLPEGYVVTQPNAQPPASDQPPTTSDQSDSDASPDEGRTVPTGFLPGGTADHTLDMGIHLPPVGLVRVGGQVWEDINLDGEVDPEEPLQPNIVVAIYEQGDPTSPVATATTDEEGHYLFENLPAGEYYTALLPESLPEGALPPSYYSAGVLDDLRSNSGLLEEGDEALALDMALRFVGSLSGLVWMDEDGNGVRLPEEVDREISLDNMTVLLYDATGEVVGEMAINPDGSYRFDDLIPGDYRVEFMNPVPYYISPNHRGSDLTRNSDADPETRQTHAVVVQSGEHVPYIDMGLYEGASFNSLLWFDTDGNGLQEEGEQGIPNVAVLLFSVIEAQDDEVIDETVTDDEGHYAFGGLVQGDYYVAFEPPADMIAVVEIQNQGRNLVRGPMISIETNQNVAVQEIGFTEPAALGNYVWLDANKNGVADEGETSVADAVVHLLDADGNLMDTTTTDSEGRFEFVVVPGDYQLNFMAADGMTFTQQNQGDDELDSDVDPASGRTAMISIEPGETDFSHDAGLIVSPTAIQLMSLSATTVSSGVTIEWHTNAELSTFGFEVYRSRDALFENAVAVTDGLILARGEDATYTFSDNSVHIGQAYSYWLVEVQNDQAHYRYGPISVIVDDVDLAGGINLMFLPIIQK